MSCLGENLTEGEARVNLVTYPLPLCRLFIHSLPGRNVVAPAFRSEPTPCLARSTSESTLGVAVPVGTLREESVPFLTPKSQICQHFHQSAA